MKRSATCNIAVLKKVSFHLSCMHNRTETIDWTSVVEIAPKFVSETVRKTILCENVSNWISVITSHATPVK